MIFTLFRVEEIPAYTPNYYNPAIYHYNSTAWTNITESTDAGLANTWDLSTVSVDPSDAKRIYSGAFVGGLT